MKLGACLLKLSDPAGAYDAFSEALKLKAGLAPRIARIWKAEGQAALREGEPGRAAAHFTEAVTLDPALAQPLGIDLIKAADRLDDETRRARLVTRAAPWAGTSYAALRTANWYTRRFGPPRRLKLDEPGWVELAGGLLPGDILYYVSSEKLQQRDAGSVRILPQALDIPVKLTLTGRDVGERGDTSIWVGRADQRVEAWFWLLPGGQERPGR